MLPPLRSLKWLFVPSTRLQSCVPLLVSPRLAHVQLHFGDGSPERCLPVINTLIEAAGSLESVEITPGFDRPEMQDAGSKLLLSCNPNLLHEFCVASPISKAVLICAAQPPELQEFSIRGSTPGLADPLPLTIFPSLRTILISTGGLPTWLEFFRHIQSKHLRDLLVDFEAGDNGNLPTILTYLQHSGIHRTLTELCLFPGEGWIIDRVSIAPLLVLGEPISPAIFTEFEDSRCTFLLSDKDIEQLVKAMLKLRALLLGLLCPEQMCDDLTVKSLVMITKHCKALESLEMHVNCESIVTSTDERELPGLFDFNTKAPSEVIPSEYDGCPLRTAIFGSCPIPLDEEGGIIFALTLLRLFPRLSEVQWLPFDDLVPCLSVNATIADHNLVRQSLVGFGGFMYV